MKNRFSRWPSRQPSWISDRNDFSFFFYLQVTLVLPTKFQVNWPFGSEEGINRFTRYLGFAIGMILAVSDLPVTLMFATKFEVNWPFGSGEEVKNRFTRWPLWWISDRNNFSYFFDLPVYPMHPTKFRVNWPLGLGKEVKNKLSRLLPWGPSWTSDRKDFSIFLSTSHSDTSYQASNQ